MTEPEIRSVITSAGKNLHTIQIKAYKGNGELVERTMGPYSIKPTPKNNMAFWGLDMHEKKTRSFLLENILSVKETTDSYVPQYSVEF